jgi:hypothetical protein
MEEGFSGQPRRLTPPSIIPPISRYLFQKIFGVLEILIYDLKLNIMLIG